MAGREPIPCMDELHRNFVQMSGMGGAGTHPGLCRESVAEVSASVVPGPGLWEREREGVGSS